jgi:hypothetical protein
MDVDQWEFLGDAGDLQAGTGYTLRNRINDRSLRYGERDWGINLVWDRVVNLANIILRRRAESGPIRFGEPVAIRVHGGGHLRYGERDNGINLVWADSPVFEWAVGGRTPGTAVRARQRVRLVNLAHGDYLTYGERSRGINLRWWADVGGYGSYPPLPMPERFRGRSGEPGQALLQGRAARVSIFHGGVDDELDWHIYLRPDATDRRALFTHLLAHGKGAKSAHGVGGAFLPIVEEDLAEIACEWMVLDGYDNSLFDERFFSADVTRALRLRESAWEYSRRAGADQNVEGASEVADSDLVGARVYVHGPLVNDADHLFKVEIHPVDSVAYALDASRRPVRVPASDPDWPTDNLTWRVAAFSNSSFHRINEADYLKRDRTTTWHLPLPSRIASSGDANLQVLKLGFTNEGRRHSGLDDIRQTSTDTYAFSGVATESAAVVRDPVDGRFKLRVSVRMERPENRWGGMFLADYRIGADAGPAVTAAGPHALDVFVRGRHDHDFVHRFFDGENWSGWINLGGDLAAGPAVTAGGPHPLDVFVRGSGDDLVHRFFDGRQWSGWINLGGDLASAPAVTAGGPHPLDVFVRGRHNDELVHRFFDGREWSGWINLGGDLASAPAVTAGGPHALDVFVRGAGHELVHRFFHNGRWSGWFNLGGDLASAPAVTADGPHSLDVFVRGAGDDLVHRFFDGREWSGWINLGGDLASAPAVTAGGLHPLDVFVRGRHGDELVHRFFDGREWSGWINLGGDLG